MKCYAVYESNIDGTQSWIESYWLNYEKAVERYKKIWPYIRELTEDEIKYGVREIKIEEE